MVAMKRVLILTSDEIRQKTTRLAYQIVEDNYNTRELTLIGVKLNGYTYAAQLKKEIELIDNSIETTLLELELDKENPLGKEIKLKLASSLNDKTVIIIDDVANTGKTLFYALQPILKFSPGKVQVAILVDRQHKLYPVSPDFVGLSLSTTLKEHIVVEFDKKGNGSAYLS